MDFHIRNEEADDIGTIDAIIKEAFRQHPHSSHTEHLIIEGLRQEAALSLSLVAVTDNTVVGHIAFSEIEISDGSTGWFGLGPLAVAAGMRGKGVGSALVREGLSRLKHNGAQGCVVLGEPGFYSRFGFHNTPEIMIEEAPQEHFLALAFSNKGATGVVTYHPVFYTAC